MEDTDDAMESSQPSTPTDGSSNRELRGVIVDTIVYGSVGDDILEDEILPEEGSPDLVLHDALEYIADENADEDTLVQDLGELVFSTTDAGDKEENN
jgi:hypothetical protein